MKPEWQRGGQEGEAELSQDQREDRRYCSASLSLMVDVERGGRDEKRRIIRKDKGSAREDVEKSEAEKRARFTDLSAEIEGLATCTTFEADNYAR